MVKETSIAYPRLKRDWGNIGGRALRLRPPGVKGIPDFALFQKRLGTAMCEVKCVELRNDRIGIDYNQIDMLRDIVKHGGQAFCLVLCLETKQWVVFNDGVHVDCKWKGGGIPCKDGNDLLERMMWM